MFHVESQHLWCDSHIQMFFADICSGCYVCEAAVDSGIMHDSEGYLMEQLYNGKTAS